MFGDFNEILSQDEKWGGRNRPQQQLDDFQQMLWDCELRDIGFNGSKYTWYNGRSEGAQVFERLDRLLGNSSWCNLFGEAKVYHGSIAYSDHLPLWMDMKGKYSVTQGPRPFRFESMWLGEVGCSEIVKTA